MVNTKHIVSLCLLFLVSPAIYAQSTLSKVNDRGFIICGVNPDLPGFSSKNSLDEYSGFDVDYCRALSAAIFTAPDRVAYKPLSATLRLEALSDGEIDVLSRNTTWTLSRNTLYSFVGTSFYDGQGFLVSKRTGIRSALELDNQPICVSRGTTTELNASDYFRESNMRYKPVYFEDETDAAQAYADDQCSALTTDRSALAAQRVGFSKPDSHLVLPEVISKEPLGPVVRNDDKQWENIARWTLACMINAEELGIDQISILSNTFVNTSPAVQRLLGKEGDAGELLGLSTEWCSNVVKGIGNYAEVYERHIGEQTPVGLQRGVNMLWTNGGILYAPPVR